MRVKSFTGAAAVCAVLASLLAAPAAHAAPAVPWEVQATVNAYQRTYPGLTESQARRAHSGQAQRIRLLEQLQAQHLDGFGGSWYDPYTDAQHINAVGRSAAQKALTLGSDLGLKTQTHEVAVSLKDLLAQAKVTGAAVDVVNNRVEASVAQVSGPELCTDKLHCGRPLRSGIALWANNLGNRCSLGFTAHGGDGSRWAVTAGHCAIQSGGNNVIWGHGEQAIGPIRYAVQSGNIDTARIHVQSTYWRTGGYLFNLDSADSPLDVDFAINNRGTIQVGDAVCLSAWHSTQTDSCGVITIAYGTYGMPHVGFDACAGDSGGGWYYTDSFGQRWAYGIHHGQSNGDNITCHEHGVNDSVFTTVPDLNDYWDSTTVSSLRLETR